MRIDGHHDDAEPDRAPDGGRFQQALQEARKERAKGPEPLLLPSPRRSPGRLSGALSGGAQPPGSLSPHGPPPTASPLRATAPRALTRAEYLGQVRQRLHEEVHRQSLERGTAQRMAQEQVGQRLAEFISRELSREWGLDGLPRSQLAPPNAGTSPPPSLTEPPPASGAPRASEGTGGTCPSAEASRPEARLQAAMELIERLEVFVKSQRPALALHLGGALEARVEVERTGAREVALRIEGYRSPLSPAELGRIREALSARGIRLSALIAS